MKGAVCVKQVSDLESDVNYLPHSQTVVALSSMSPVIGESFCQCERQEELGPGLSVSRECHCGEEDQGEQKLMKTVMHRII